MREVDREREREKGEGAGAQMLTEGPDYVVLCICMSTHCIL